MADENIKSEKLINKDLLNIIIGGVAVSAIFWFSGAFKSKLSNYDYLAIAKELARNDVYRDLVIKELGFENAVLAIKDSECPTGWAKWDLASGRFLRGIDWKDLKIDADGIRAPGQQQNESIKDHDHFFPNMYANNDGGRLADNYGAMPYHPPQKPEHNGKKIQTPQRDWKIENKSLGKETVPDNVAVLFCVKN